MLKTLQATASFPSTSLTVSMVRVCDISVPGHDYIQDNIDIEGARLNFKIRHTRTDLTAQPSWQSAALAFQRT